MDIRDEVVRGFTLAEACAQTGLGRTTLYAAIRSGALVARKFGRRTVILSNDLATFLARLPPANRPPYEGHSR